MENMTQNTTNKHQGPWLFAIIVFLIMAAGLGAYLYRQGSRSYDYSYSPNQQKQVILPASKNTNKASLEVPAQFTRQDRSINIPSVILGQAIKYKGKNVSIGLVGLTETPKTNAVTPALVSHIGQALLDKSAAEHDLYTKIVSMTAGYILGSQYDCTLDNARSFSNPTIRQNAWAFDLQAPPKTSGNKLPVLNGEVIFAAGKTNFYEVLLANQAGDWQSNQVQWQRVISSLRIDQ